MAKQKDKPETIAVQAGRMTQEHFGAVNTPVYRASTLLFPTLDALEGHAPYRYGRLGTPTSKSFEDAIMALEGGACTVVVPSGLAAISLGLLSVCGAGDHLLMTDTCYFPTRTLCDTTLKRFGIEATYYDPLIGEGIAGLIRPNTKAVFCESPGSLTFEIQDIPAIAKAAHTRGISVLMDNTWATPLYFDAFGHGVDIIVQAATKYIGGHSDVMLGYVSANESHKKALTDAHHTLGLHASVDDCFLGLRGIRTLPVRLARHMETGLKLARWLKTRPEVTRVLHPALKDDPGHALWKRDFTGACGLFSFELKPVSRAGLAAFVDGLAHFGMGWSWGGYESLIVPAHIVRTAKPFAHEGPVLRIHAGLEDPDDLIADLDAGFERLKAAA